MRKQYNVNQFQRRPPKRTEILKAKALAQKVSAKLYSMMEAKTVKNAA
jgi:hypothetical protein